MAAGTYADQVEAFLRHLRVERGLSDNTVSSYRRDLRSYGAWLAEQGVADATAVTERQLRDYPQWLVDRRRDDEVDTSPATVARMLSAVRSFHHALFLGGSAAHDPSKALHAPKRPGRLPKALNIDEVQAVLEAASGSDPAAVRDRALLEFLYATGARVSEACGLLVDDVQRLELDPDRGTADEATVLDVVRLRGKGDKERLVPLGSFAREAIDAYTVRVRPALAALGKARAHLFLGVRGAPLSRQAVWTIITQAAARVGLEHRVSPHVMRHSFATHLLSGGADIRVVQELLGHASVTTTQVYTKVTQEGLREVYATAHPRARHHREH